MCHRDCSERVRLFVWQWQERLSRLKYLRQGTTCAEAQVATLRERLIKLPVWITRSARRSVLHFPQAFPWLGPWCQVARAGGARAG